MFRRWATLCFLLVVVTASTHSAGPPGLQNLSANGQYSVELSRTPEKTILISVFELSKENKSLHWSRPVDWEEEDRGWVPTFLEIKPLVSNDGKTVVMRDENSPNPKGDLFIYGRSEGDDHHIRLFDRPDLTSARRPEDFPGPQRSVRDMRNTSYMFMGALLDFIVDEEKSYAVWFGQTDRWALISLDTFKLTLVDDPEKISRLNEIARHKALELISEHQPSSLRRILTTLQQRISRIYPSAAPAYRRNYMTVETSAAYLFLTWRKQSGDKIYIEHLLGFPSEGIERGMFMREASLDINYEAKGGERLLGDYLLSRWNGETNREMLPREMHLLLPQDSARYLGAIHLDFQLPIQVPRTNSGVLWTYLIPARLPVGQTNTSADVITFSTSLQYGVDQSGGPPIGPQGSANFRLLTSGDYRLKMIWDRHALPGTWRTNIYAAMPGDYESSETSTITVKPGQVTEHISLVCTNRLGTAADYLEDDRQANVKKK